MYNTIYKMSNGSYSVCFEHNGGNYWAELSLLRYGNDYSECMIFRADDFGFVDDWNEVYHKLNIPVTEKSLIECIEDFKTNSKYE